VKTVSGNDVRHSLA